MNENELKMFLARAAIIDKRNIDQATLLHWGEILGDITYHEANAALVATRRTMEPREYLVPSHITRKVYKWRSAYADAHPENPGTQGLTYLPELGTYYAPQDAGRALQNYYAERGITYTPNAVPTTSNGEITT